MASQLTNAGPIGASTGSLEVAIARTRNLKTKRLQTHTLSGAGISLVPKASQDAPVSSNRGILWTRTDEKLMYTDGEGTETNLTDATDMDFITLTAEAGPAATPEAGTASIVLTNGTHDTFSFLSPAGSLDVTPSRGASFGSCSIGGGSVSTLTENSIAIGNGASTGAEDFAVSIGYDAGSNASQVGYGSFCVGHGAGNTNPGGSYTRSSIIIGTGADVTAASLDVFVVGSGAYTMSTVYAMCIGKQAHTSTSPAHAIGAYASASHDALAVGARSIASGDGAVAIGGMAEASTSSIAIGYNATANFSSAVAIGANTNIYGINGVAIGYAARAGANSTAIGYGAIAALAGTGGTAIGYKANATDTNCISIGSNSNADGASIAVGYLAFATGTNSIAIGYGAYAVSGGIAVGRAASAPFTNSIAIGYGAICSGANVFQLGNASISSFRSPVALTVTSDARFKTNPIDVPAAAAHEALVALTPIIYNLDALGIKMLQNKSSEMVCLAGCVCDETCQVKCAMQQRYDEMFDPATCNDAKNTRTVGFVAQDVYAKLTSGGQIDPRTVVSIPEDESCEVWGVKYESMIPLLIKSLQVLAVEASNIEQIIAVA